VPRGWPGPPRRLLLWLFCRRHLFLTSPLWLWHSLAVLPSNRTRSRHARCADYNTPEMSVRTGASDVLQVGVAGAQAPCSGLVEHDRDLDFRALAGHAHHGAFPEPRMAHAFTAPERGNGSAAGRNGRPGRLRNGARQAGRRPGRSAELLTENV